MAGLLATAVSAGAAGDPDPATALAAAEAALVRGDVAAARRSLEAQAALGHVAAVELALVRVGVREGRWREALDLAAHVAAESDAAEAPVLYARMLAAQGQRAAALDALAQAERRLGAAGALQDERRRLGGAVVPSVPALPFAVDRPGGAVVGTATRLDARHALVAAALPDAGAALRLRDARGREFAGRVQERSGALALLEIDAAAEPAPQAPEAAAHDAFPGSPAFVAVYVADPQDRAAMPWLRPGFLGRASEGPDIRALGIALPPGRHAALALDAAGRWIGVALGEETGEAQFVPVSRLPARWRAPAPAGAPGGAPRLPAALLYERAAALTLQVLAPAR